MYRLVRYATQPGTDPLTSVAWERRNAVIHGSGGAVVFEQADIEMPAAWSELACNVVASKYFRGNLATAGRESSVKQLLRRVVGSIAQWCGAGMILASSDDLQVFRDELTHLVLHQKASFNSPVWFNVGVETHPQCSACFINSVRDTMESILELAQTEGRLFKFGSGTGSNLSVLRSKHEPLSGGGTASGPVSFMRGFDAFAGVIKSGGKTRRAAKMVILNADHPDVLDFVWCKAREEQKAWALIDAGYDGAVDGEAYGSVFFQNSNNSVRVTDAFMQAVAADAPWTTYYRVSKEPARTYPAGDIMRQICEAAHLCGDPGLQFHDTINKWHTCPASGPIEASNPCSEYMFLNDTACNLASLNLLKFTDDAGQFNAAAFAHAVQVTVLAQEVLVDAASYPTPLIGKNSHMFRPLGLGYANLGALLMASGMPYDSDEGRHLAAAVTALMTGTAFVESARIAAAKGPFDGFAANRDAMLAVVELHRQAAHALAAGPLRAAAVAAWDQAATLGVQHGFRNAQLTVLAPTGTIGFMMDCDTTGVEPDVALVKHKSLVGGGVLKWVNGTIPRALAHLGYDAPTRQALLAYLENNETFEGSPLREEHLAVFDCAFCPAEATRRIAPAGHVKMMAAVQPFLSGAISKTVNLPTNATVEQIDEIYRLAWQLGVKAVAVYRDGCKRSQPLRTGRGTRALSQEQMDAPACGMCGTVMVRAGPCYRCTNCGTSSACS